MSLEIQEQTSTGLSKSMEQYFAEFEKQALEWALKAEQIQVTDASQTDLIESAKECRLGLKRVRTGVIQKHKELKEESLREGQMLDSIKRKLVGLIEPIEAHLQEQENFVEVQEQKRKDALYSSRLAILSKLIGDEARTIQLGEMSEQVFDSIVRGYEAGQKEKAELAEKERLAKIEAERIAAEERLKIQQENDRLKAERDKVVAQQRLEREAAEKERLKQEAKLKESRDKLKALEVAAQKIKDEEELAKKEQAAADRKMKRAPDKERLLHLAGLIATIEIPKLKDEDAQKIVNNAKVLLVKVHKYITENAESL